MDRIGKTSEEISSKTKIASYALHASVLFLNLSMPFVTI